jgi:hypothetical protein
MQLRYVFSGMTRAVEAVKSLFETFSFLRRPLETLLDAGVASCLPLHMWLFRIIATIFTS